MNNSFSKHIDLINSSLGVDIHVHNDYFVASGARFKEFKRVISYLDKSFDIEDELSANRSLNCIAMLYRSEPDPTYGNFTWTADKHIYFNDETGEFDDDGVFVASSKIKVKMPWGTAHINKKNRVKPVFNIEGMETGFLVINSTSDAKLLAFEPENTRLINHDSTNHTAIVIKTFTYHRAYTKTKNTVTSEMIPSLIEWCSAGVITQVKSAVTHEIKIASSIIKNPTTLTIAPLRINKMTPIALVDKVIHRMSSREATEAIKEVVSACARLGKPIPENIASMIASRSNLDTKISDTDKKFVFGILDMFFIVSKGFSTIISERYGNAQYVYASANDNASARRLAKKIKSIDTVSDMVSHMPIDDMIAVVHEYIRDYVGTSESSVSDMCYEFDNVRMFFKYGKREIRFESTNLKTVSKNTKWIIADRASYKGKNLVNRAKSYLFIFNSLKDANTALRSTYGLALAILFDIEYRVSVYYTTKVGKVNAKRYFCSRAFNPISSVGKDPDLLTLKDGEFAFINEGREDYHPNIKQKVVFVEHEEDADIVMSQESFGPAKYVMSRRLEGTHPDKLYARFFRDCLTMISSQYSDHDHLKTHLENEDNFYNLVSNIRMNLIK